MNKIIIEVRINELTSREVNPNVPWTPQEIISDGLECGEAGASVVHFHPRNPDGSANNQYEYNLEIVSGFRERSDLLIHPTLGGSFNTNSQADRIARVLKLSADGYTPDLAPLDMASTNLDMIDPKTHQFVSTETVYENTVGTLHHFSKTLQEVGIKPYLQIWNVGSLRLTSNFIRNRILANPVFMSLSMSDGPLIWGHPPTPEGLAAYLSFLPTGAPLEWSAHSYGGNLLPLVGLVAQRGGHIAIGLGDYAYRELGVPTNADVIARVVQIAKDCGREIATPDEARQILGIQKKPVALKKASRAS